MGMQLSRVCRLLHLDQEAQHLNIARQHCKETWHGQMAGKGCNV
jgi:hypothetical protein